MAAEILDQYHFTEMAKYKSVKMDNESLRKIWEASRGNVYRNRKKYVRKKKHNNREI